MKKSEMKIWGIIILICTLFCCQTPVIGQFTKLTKEERKQERKYMDSLFVIYSLPIDIEATSGFFNLPIRDSVIEILKRKGYDCPGQPTVGNLIKEKMMDFLPSPYDKNYSETMDKIGKDKNYVLQLLEQSEPFMQRIELIQGQDDSGKIFVRVKRQNYPNGRKMREWTFKYEESEAINVLAMRMVVVLTNKNKIQ